MRINRNGLFRKNILPCKFQKQTPKSVIDLPRIAKMSRTFARISAKNFDAFADTNREECESGWKTKCKYDANASEAVNPAE